MLCCFSKIFKSLFKFYYYFFIQIDTDIAKYANDIEFSMNITWTNMRWLKIKLLFAQLLDHLVLKASMPICFRTQIKMTYSHQIQPYEQLTVVFFCFYTGFIQSISTFFPDAFKKFRVKLIIKKPANQIFFAHFI